MAQSRYASLLRERELRVTAQRCAVLAALDQGGHLSATALADRVAASPTALSWQGLYNVLDDLSRAQLIRSIEPAGSPALYELRAGDNHHHLVCRECGRVEDVSCALGRAPCLEPVSAGGFQIDEAEVTWWGRCAQCTSGRGSE